MWAPSWRHALRRVRMATGNATSAMEGRAPPRPHDWNRVAMHREPPDAAERVPPERRPHTDFGRLRLLRRNRHNPRPSTAGKTWLVSRRYVQWRRHKRRAEPTLASNRLPAAHNRSLHIMQVMLSCT